MENNSFSVKENAGKSFKTFILTLSVSLIVFSVIYFFLTNNSSNPESFETSLSDKSSNQQSAQGATDTNTQKSVFKEIASKDPGVALREVLAGATADTAITDTSQTTQSGNLSTGTTNVTIGLFVALVFFLSALVIVSRNPRKLALSSFEKSVTKDIDDSGKSF